MLQAKAKRIFETLDGEKPFLSRLEYVEALAALAALHPEDMVRKVTGANHEPVCQPCPLVLLFANTAGVVVEQYRWRHNISPKLSSAGYDVYNRRACNCSYEPTTEEPLT